MTDSLSTFDIDFWSELYDELDSKIGSLNVVKSKNTRTHIALRLADIVTKSKQVQELVNEFKGVTPEEFRKAADICVELRVILETQCYFIKEVTKN